MPREVPSLCTNHDGQVLLWTLQPPRSAFLGGTGCKGAPGRVTHGSPKSDTPPRMPFLAPLSRRMPHAQDLLYTPYFMGEKARPWGPSPRGTSTSLGPGTRIQGRALLCILAELPCAGPAHSGSGHLPVCAHSGKLSIALLCSPSSPFSSN